MIFIDAEFGCNCCNCEYWACFDEENEPLTSLSGGYCEFWSISTQKYKFITLAWDFCSKGKEKTNDL